MRAPLSWLRDHVRVDATPHQIARRLNVSTLEVERVIEAGVPDVGGNLGHFVVGRVLEAVKHPNADKLQLCQVDVGNPDPQQIVCGAWNFGAGATVAVGLPGAQLPGFPAPLDERKLRGEVSRGMILAEDEIGLGTDHSGIMLLPDGLAPGTPLSEALPLVDHVLDVTTTMNRVDLLSIAGLAREIALLCDGELIELDVEDPPIRHPELVEISVEDPVGCPRYIGRSFRDVHVGPSPVWMRARLHLAGMRSISNVVDVTNYVMHVYGSPLHAFDRSRLADGKIVVRRARDGEELRTLDGARRQLDARDLLITDGEKAVALAAIMGGLESEVSDDTTEVLLEAANFEPIGILRTSERLALRTEGSNRWEKGVDPYMAHPAVVLASRLLVDLTGAELTGSADVHRGLPERPVVTLRPGRTDRIVGLEVDPAEQRTILEGLGFDVGDDWEVTVPTWRARDVTREIDVVEEVARAVLDRVPRTMPLRRHVAGHLTREQRLRRLVEDVLVGAGYCEAYTWSLVADDPDPAAVRLPDPMSGDQAILRTTLLAGLRRVGSDEPGRRQRADRPVRARACVPPLRRAAAGRALACRRYRVGRVLGCPSRRRGRARGAPSRPRGPPLRAPVVASGEERRHGSRVVRRAASRAARGRVGRLRARSRDADRSRAGADPLRGRRHVSGEPAGPGDRRRRWGRGRGARLHGA